MAIYLIYQHLPLEDPPKFTKIGTLDLKIYHLATLLVDRSKTVRKKRHFIYSEDHYQVKDIF
jgi:hypothetical protein